MPFRSHLAAAAALVVVLVASGCDSNSSNSALRELDGTYTVAQLLFDPAPQVLPDVDVLARLNTSATRLEIFGEDGQVLFRTRFADASGSRLTEMTAAATRGRATLTAVTVDDESELADLLLPRQIVLTYSATDPSDLTGEPFLTNVDLAAFDPQYNGLGPVNGTLRIRFARSVN